MDPYLTACFSFKWMAVIWRENLDLITIQLSHLLLPLAHTERSPWIQAVLNENKCVSAIWYGHIYLPELYDIISKYMTPKHLSILHFAHVRNTANTQDTLAKAMLDIGTCQNDSRENPFQCLSPQIITVMEATTGAEALQDLAQLSEEMSLFVRIRDAGLCH